MMGREAVVRLLEQGRGLDNRTVQLIAFNLNRQRRLGARRVVVSFHEKPWDGSPVVRSTDELRKFLEGTNSDTRVVRAHYFMESIHGSPYSLGDLKRELENPKFTIAGIGWKTRQKWLERLNEVLEKK